MPVFFSQHSTDLLSTAVDGHVARDGRRSSTNAQLIATESKHGSSDRSEHSWQRQCIVGWPFVLRTDLCDDTVDRASVVHLRDSARSNVLLRVVASDGSERAADDVQQSRRCLRKSHDKVSHGRSRRIDRSRASSTCNTGLVTSERGGEKNRRVRTARKRMSAS